LVETTIADGHLSLTGTPGQAKLVLPSDALKLDFKLAILDCGTCEGLKLGVHAATLALAVVMGAYNAAAWLRRREQHLALNAVLYAALIAFEREHVVHHLALLREPSPPPLDAAAKALDPVPPVLHASPPALIQ
jgi:hypothetical protein